MRLVLFSIALLISLPSGLNAQQRHFVNGDFPDPSVFVAWGPRDSSGLSLSISGPHTISGRFETIRYALALKNSGNAAYKICDLGPEGVMYLKNLQGDTIPRTPGGRAYDRYQISADVPTLGPGKTQSVSSWLLYGDYKTAPSGDFDLVAVVDVYSFDTATHDCGKKIASLTSGPFRVHIQ